MNIEKQTKNIIDFVNKFVAGLNSAAGTINSNDAMNIAKASVFAQDLITYLDNNGYGTMIDEFSQEIISTVNKTLSKARRNNKALNNIKFDKASIQSLIALNATEISDLQGSIASDLKQMIIRAIVIGQPPRQLLESIGKYVDLNFKNKLSTIYNTLENTYQQKTEDILAKQIEFDGVWEYIGSPLQANSHPECVWALTEKPNAPYFTTEEKEQFEAGIIPTHLAGRSAIRYNCQHYFIMVDKKI